MSGDSVLRWYVYGLVLALVLWALFVGWLVTRAAWRRVRTVRAARAVHPSGVAGAGTIPMGGEHVLLTGPEG